MTKIRFDKTRLVCTGCGAEAHAACVCGMAYEVLAEKREADRQRRPTGQGNMSKNNHRVT
jgi:hypothetical protein